MSLFTSYWFHFSLTIYRLSACQIVSYSDSSIPRLIHYIPLPYLLSYILLNTIIIFDLAFGAVIFVTKMKIPFRIHKNHFLPSSLPPILRMPYRHFFFSGVLHTIDIHHWITVNILHPVLISSINIPDLKVPLLIILLSP